MPLTGSSVNWTKSRKESKSLKTSQQEISKIAWTQKKLKTEQSLWELWNNFKDITCTTKAEEIMAMNFPKLMTDTKPHILKLRELQAG